MVEKYGKRNKVKETVLKNVKLNAPEKPEKRLKTYLVQKS